MKISDLFDREFKIMVIKMLIKVRKQYMKKMLFQQTENIKKSEDSLRDLWDTIKWINVCIRVSQNEKTERNIRLIQRSNIPGCSAVKNPPANAGDEGLIPGLGRSGERNGNPLQPKFEIHHIICLTLKLVLNTLLVSCGYCNKLPLILWLQ